jgi:serine/threonine protein kinase
VFARKVIKRSHHNETGKNELRVITKLCNAGHRNIITVLKHGEFEDMSCFYIDMELCEMNLDQYNQASWTVAKFHTSPDHEHRTWKIMAQIANGLVFIHEKQEIHRDLKPKNGSIVVILRSNLTVLYSQIDQVWKLADFGITSEIPTGTALETIYMRGTDGYRAPEILAQKPYDAKVDIFALACILYELAAGTRLFRSDYAVTEYSHQRSSITLNMSVTNGDTTCSELFQKMVLVDPKLRPTAEQVLAVCTRALENIQSPIREGLNPRVPPPPLQPIIATRTLSWANRRSAFGLTQPVSFRLCSRTAASTMSTVFAFVVNRDNSRLAVLSYNPDSEALSLVIYDVNGRSMWKKQIHIAQYVVASLPCPTFSQDGQFVAFSIEDGQIEIVDIERSSQVGYQPQVKPRMSATIRAIAIGPQGSPLAVALFDNSKQPHGSLASTSANSIVTIKTPYLTAGMTYSAGERFLVIVGQFKEKVFLECWEMATLTKRTNTWWNHIYLREPILYPLGPPLAVPRIFLRLHVSTMPGDRRRQFWIYLTNKAETQTMGNAREQIAAVWGDQVVSLQPDGTLVRQEGNAGPVVVGKIEEGLPSFERIKGIAVSETRVVLVLDDGDFVLFSRISE